MKSPAECVEEFYINVCNQLLVRGALGEVDQKEAGWVARLAAARYQEREAMRVEVAAVAAATAAAPAAPSLRAKVLAKPPAKGKSTPAAVAARSGGPMSNSVARGMLGSGEAGGRAGNSAPGGRAGNSAPGGRAGNSAPGGVATNKTADRANKPFKVLSTEEKKTRKQRCASYLHGTVNPARKKAQLEPVPVPEQAMLLVNLAIRGS